jgi:hypothetical protein
MFYLISVSPGKDIASVFNGEHGVAQVKAEPGALPKKADDIIDISDGEDSAKEQGTPSARQRKCEDDDDVINISD